MRPGDRFVRAEFNYGDRDRRIVAEGTLTKFYPAVMYLSNGDPGYPAEGGEIEDIEAWIAHTLKFGASKPELSEARKKEGYKVRRDAGRWEILRPIEPDDRLTERIEEELYESAGEADDD